MAQADGVVANGTGAAVRSDLNGQLAALFTNHSGSTEPGTTYAYQWWADTNANVLKLRNSANDGWITLRELDGTMLIEDGSASTPGLAFADDTNTGIFSPAADQIGFATNGVERLEISNSAIKFNDGGNDVDFRVESNGNTHRLFVDAGNDRVGIGTSSPSTKLSVSGGISGTAGANISGSGWGVLPYVANSFVADSTSGQTRLFATGTDASTHGNFLFFTGTTNGTASERVRIDSSGRLLVGTSTASSAGNSQYSKIEVSGNTSSATGPGHMTIKAGEAASTMSDDDTVGRLMFSSLTGGDFAHIQASIDGSPSGSDFPGRLMFFTCADGASSPTERMRIQSNGQVEFKNGSFADNIDCVMANSGTMEIGAQTEIKFRTATNERMRVTDNGLTFNGDTAAANALDDYEEGGWTPTANQSISLTVYEANYVKIGASVTYTTYFAVGTNSGSSDLIISGFPFNAIGANNYHACAVNSDANLGHQLVAQYNRGSGSGQVQLVKTDSNTKATGADMSGKFVIFTLTVTLH